MPTAHGYKRLRTGRVSEPGRVYIVTFVTLGRSRAFADDIVASCAARAIVNQANLPGARLLCWVLMPDHWHGLIELCDARSLSSVVSRFKACVARSVNRETGREGSLWMKGFHDRALRKEDDMVTASRYIVANPLRAGIVDEIGQYPYWNAIWF